MCIVYKAIILISFYGIVSFVGPLLQMSKLVDIFVNKLLKSEKRETKKVQVDDHRR